MLIHTLPPRRMCLVMATRAASICRLVIQPGSKARSPKSPKWTSVPPLARPLMRPRCCLRCLTFFGINISAATPWTLARCGTPAGRPARGGRASRAARLLPGLPRFRRGYGNALFHFPHVGDERAPGCAARRSDRHAGQGAGPGSGGFLLLYGDLVPVVDPDLDADHAERGLRL